jgi:hypothetical protein
MGFGNVKNYVDCQVDLGKYQTSSFRKAVAAGPGVGVWYDCSTIPGNPVANFYASEPLVSAQLLANRGIFHGASQPTESKFLSKVMINGIAAFPCPFMMLDYLLYYPFIDMDATASQSLDNTIPISRYTDGKGVFAMLVAQSTYTGGQTFIINYTNQDGVSGRVSPLAATNTTGFSGNLVNSPASGVLANGYGPFIPLASGDRGIRSIESITFSAANGGIAALVLVKPITNFFVRELVSPFEREFFNDMASLPRIQEGAYLNFIARPTGTSITFAGQADFTWG